MRTTLDIDEDVLDAAKELAAEQKVSAGKVISDLARKALIGVPPKHQQYKNGVPLFPSRGRVISADEVQKMIDELG